MEHPSRPKLCCTRSPRLLRYALASAMCLSLLGCGFSMGPQVRTQVVIVHPGNPIRVVSQSRVDGRAMNQPADAPSSNVDIGGWVAIPPDHWDVIKKRLEGNE